MRVSFEPHPDLDLDLDLAEIVPHPRSERDPKTKRARRFEVRSLLWAGAARADLFGTQLAFNSFQITARVARCAVRATSLPIVDWSELASIACKSPHPRIRALSRFDTIVVL